MPYTSIQLTYSRSSRCKCGAGLAYLNDGNIHGAWSCSAVLRGDAEPGTAHDEPLPFAFYEVKSEHSTPGVTQTTRPEGFVSRDKIEYVGPELVEAACPNCNGTGKVRR